MIGPASAWALACLLTLPISNCWAQVPDPPPAQTQTPVESKTPVHTPVPDDEIRAMFAGKAACPPLPWPVSFGPHEFRADGTYYRMQDLASAYGRYTIAKGKICISFSGPNPPDFCLIVTKNDGHYFFQYDSPRFPANQQPYFHTPCPLTN
jgi:hypothetical protein